MSKSSFFFYQITRFNYLFAHILSWFGTVCYWRTTLPKISSTFFQLDFVDRDDWLESKEKSHNCLVELGNKSLGLRTKLAGVDFTKYFEQQFVVDFEYNVLFFELIERCRVEGSLYFVSDFSFAKTSKHIERRYPFRALTFFSTLNLMFGFLSELLHKKKHDLREIVKAIIYFKAKGNTYNYLFEGFSSTDMSGGDLDGSFLSWVKKDQNIFKNSLFILPTRPNFKFETKLKDLGISYLEKRKIISLLPNGYKLLVILRALLDFFIHFTPRTPPRASLLIWKYLCDAGSLQGYFSTVSDGWPYPFYLDVLTSYDIKSVCWFYSGSEFYATEHKLTEKFKSVRFSIQGYSEYWVWSSYIEDLFSLRILWNHSARIRIVRPIMNGCEDFCKLDRTKLIDLFNQQFREGLSKENLIISIFDVTPLKDFHRRNIGLGPYITTEQFDGLFEMLFLLLEKYENVTLLYKQKRNVYDQRFHQSESLNSLIKTFSDRVLLLPPTFDPYLALGLADICISMPFSSPSMLVSHYSGWGVYYDSTGCANITFKDIFSKITLFSFEEIDLLVTQYLNNNKIMYKQDMGLGELHFLDLLRENLGEVDHE